MVSTPTPPELTRYIAEFVVRTRSRDIPAEVIELGRKSIHRRLRTGDRGFRG